TTEMSTQKHRGFVGEPVGEKKVTAVPGIGPAYSARLSEAGTDKAYNLVGQYLAQNKDQASFTASLRFFGKHINLNTREEAVEAVRMSDGVE
ncbi:barrier to autointegration factor, partial [Teladorsagia circumcincta]